MSETDKWLKEEIVNVSVLVDEAEETLERPANAVPVRVGLAGYKAERVDTFCIANGADGPGYLVKRIRSHYLTTQATFRKKLAHRRPLSFLAAWLMGLSSDLPDLVAWADTQASAHLWVGRVLPRHSLQ